MERKRKNNEGVDQATLKRGKTNDEFHATIWTHGDYTVGWVCALPKELAAARLMLDRRHPDLPKPPNDPNTYILGSIGKHNVTVACLPKGLVGPNSAATLATWMVSTFPSIKFGLMVGIGGGIPSNQVRLGDIVVSTSDGPFPGVVQWDSGKEDGSGEFWRTGSLNNPPTLLLTALTRLEMQHGVDGSKIPDYLKELKENRPGLSPNYFRSASLQDVLFRAGYGHVGEDQQPFSDDQGEAIDEEEQSCRFCDKTMVVKRNPEKTDMRVHYGLIASGNKVIKNAIFRDRLNRDLGGRVRCIEMEAAGLMNNFPCLVIRGICDYADSHKNDDWQEHAAIVAAAFAKELLQCVQSSDIESERPVKDMLRDVHGITSATREDVAQIRCNLDRMQDMQILEWLTPVNYGPQQSDHFSHRELGTGHWLLEAAEFKIWLATCGQTLFCPGIQGAGKTILTSIVVNSLISKFRSDSSTGIAYIYCNFQRPTQQTTDQLLASILKQLGGNQSSLPSAIKDLYDQHQRHQTRPSLSDILPVLRSVVAAYSRVFVFVDALDECGVSENPREDFLIELSRLQKRCQINVFATSRLNLEITSEITRHFESVTQLNIHASTGDIRRYLERHLTPVPSSVKWPEKLREDIIEGILESVEGMFLLARIYLGLLRDKVSETEIRTQLAAFRKQGNALSGINKATALTYAYHQTMERINGQMPGYKKLANEVLSWITCAKRELTTTELRHALATRRKKCAVRDEDLPFKEKMVTACAGLVVVDETRDVIRLVHYTAQEYLSGKLDELFPMAEKQITTTCVTYLSFDTFNGGYCNTKEELEERLQANPLYDYAAKNWGHHARESSISCLELTSLFNSERKLEATIQVLMAGNPTLDSSYHVMFPKFVTKLHLAAYFGLAKVVEDLLQNGLGADPMDSDSRTPLSYAAEHGYESVMPLLLDTGAEIETKGSGKGQETDRTPLSFAAEHGHVAAVQLLIDNGAYLESRCTGTSLSRGWTPLSFAVENGQEAVVRLLLARGATLEPESLSIAAQEGNEAITKVLLENGAEPDSKATGIYDSGRTPLSFAAQLGYEAVVQLLLQTRRVELDSTDSDGQTPLSFAAQGGHEAIAQLLLENGAESDSKTTASYKSGRTPLSFAAENGQETLVRLLLDTGRVEPDCADSDGRTALSFAAQRGHNGIAHLLLKTGRAEVDSTDIYGRTPLWHAAFWGHESVIDLLLGEGAEPEIRATETIRGDRSWRTPLSVAAERGHGTIIKRLLREDADPDSEAIGCNEDGRTPLSFAAEGGHEAVVRLLIDHGACVDSRCSSQYRSGWTPLCFATRHGAIVELLLEKGANPEPTLRGVDGSILTPLLLAASYGSIVAVQSLLDTGRVQLDLPGEYGRTPLSYMARHGHEDIVRRLLKKGADMESESWSVDNVYGSWLRGRTPLSFAAEEGHVSTVQLFIEEGANVESKTSGGGRESGRTPLSFAAERGREAVVRLLLEMGEADPDSATLDGWTPLLYAAGKGHGSIVRLLLAMGANVDSKCIDCLCRGRTPLSFAAENSSADVVRALLDSKADPYLEDVTGQTPRSRAIRRGYQPIIKLFQEVGDR